MKVEWQESALRRVDEISDWLAENYGAAFAKDWAAGIFERTDVLANDPMIGRVVPEIRNPFVREIFYRRNHRIIYVVDEETDSCAIAGIRHVRQKTTRRNFRR